MRQQARRSVKNSSRHQTRAASPGRVPQICQGQYREPVPRICGACHSGMETGSNAPALLFIREIHPVSLQAPSLSRNLCPLLARGNMPFCWYGPLTCVMLTAATDLFSGLWRLSFSAMTRVGRGMPCPNVPGTPAVSISTGVRRSKWSAAQRAGCHPLTRTPLP